MAHFNFQDVSPVCEAPQSQPMMASMSNLMTIPQSSGGAGGSTPSNVVQYNLMQEIKNLPQGENFHMAVAAWEWSTVDGVRLPCIYRNNDKYLAVHMVQMRLLAKFPPNVPGEIMRRYTMVSHKMSVIEAWIFNTVNSMESKFEFGYQLFTSNDEVVKLLDVERFYWAVKSFNLQRMTDLYRTEIRVTASLHLVLTAHISSLKSQAENELRFLQGILSRTNMPNNGGGGGQSANQSISLRSNQQASSIQQYSNGNPTLPTVSNVLSPTAYGRHLGGGSISQQFPNTNSALPTVTGVMTPSGYGRALGGSQTNPAHFVTGASYHHPRTPNAYEAAALVSPNGLLPSQFAAVAAQYPQTAHHLLASQQAAAMYANSGLSPAAAAAALSGQIDSQHLRFPFCGGGRHGVVPRF